MRGGKRIGAGKKKGSKHTKTILWEEFGKIVLSEGLGRALEELNKLKGEKYLYHYEKFLSFFKAKSNRVDLSGEISVNQTSTPADIDSLIETLYKRVKKA